MTSCKTGLVVYKKVKAAGVNGDKFPAILNCLIEACGCASKHGISYVASFVFYSIALLIIC